MPTCAICRKAIEDQEGTTLTAGRRVLFSVHKEPCLGYVKAGVQVVGLAAFKGLHTLLAKKAPVALALLERANQLRG